MTSKKYNQFIQRMMKNEQPDKEKLIHLATFLRKEYNLTVQREAILTFDKNDGHLVGFSSWLTEEQFKKYTIHVPDLLFFVGKTMWIIEIDGYIHNVKTSVARRDGFRNECYEMAKLNFIIINEWEVLLKLGLKPNRSATASEVCQEIVKIIKKPLQTFGKGDAS